MSCIAFTGCSFVSGTGIENNEDVWISQVQQLVPEFQNLTLVNYGQQGASNSEIFYNSVNALVNHKCEFLLVSWTEVPRFLINPSVESYSTNIFLGPSAAFHDVDINLDITIPKSYIKNIRNRLFDLINPHYEFVKILKYTFSIDQLAKKFGTRVFFLNSLVDWDQDYFSPINASNRVPSNTTEKTQGILNAATRSDTEFWGLYDRIHSEYQATGGSPSQCEWINPYYSFRDHFILDLGTDQVHPGVLSHREYAKFIAAELEKRFKNQDLTITALPD